MITFSTCSDLLNYVRSLGTTVIFTEQFLTKATIFCCFDVFCVQPPQVFQVQMKISTIRPVFPDYLSVFYDYGLREEINKRVSSKTANRFGRSIRLLYTFMYMFNVQLEINLNL